MDFRNRGAGRPAATPASSNVSPSASSVSTNSSSNGSSPRPAKLSHAWLQRTAVALLFAVTVLIIAIAAFAVFGGKSQANAIKKDSYQAVFLNNGQVYFGKIKDLTNKYISLGSIYYLQTNGTATEQAGTDTTDSNNSVQLVKLGCELHGPYDQMIINEDQVLFWENLQGSSQVVKAIAQYQKDNPKGQTCSTTSNSTQQAPSSSTQNSTSTGTGATTTPTTGNSTTTKTP